MLICTQMILVKGAKKICYDVTGSRVLELLEDGWTWTFYL